MLQNSFNKHMTHHEVRLLRVFGAREGLGGLISGQLHGDAVNGVGDVLEALHEQLVALLLDPLEVVLGLLRPLPETRELLVTNSTILNCASTFIKQQIKLTLS